jgi:hypothetical protein
MTAGRAAFLFETVFTHKKAQWRQIPYLPSLPFLTHHLDQGTSTVGTGEGSMDGKSVRGSRQAESASGMPSLSAGFAPGSRTQGDGFVAGSIAGRRLAAVVTVFAQSLFELLDPC